MFGKNKVNFSKALIICAWHIGVICNINAQKFSTAVEIILQGDSQGTLIFGRHVAGQSLGMDTLQLYPDASCYRIKKENLTTGVFFVGSKQKLLFNFVLTPKDNHFNIRQVAVDSFQVEGSSENAAFFLFSKSKARIEQKIEQSKQMLEMVSRATKSDQEALKPIEEGISDLYGDIDQLGEDYRKKYPNYWSSRVLKSMEVPSLPAHIKPELKNGRANPAVRQWHRSHYFDQTDFSDSTLLYNHLWPVFFSQYFISVAHSEPDSFAFDIDRVVSKMPNEGPLYRYALRQMIENVEQAIYPGQDRVFVHLVDKYFQPERTKWIDQATLLRTKGKADLHRHNLTGNIAPSLDSLVYADGITPFHFDSVQSPFSLLIFYSPLCHHCMEVLPGVYDTWLKYKKAGLDAVAVATDDQFDFWKGFILTKEWKWKNVADPNGKLAFKEVYAAYNLPVIYLLDAQRRILWKRILAKDLDLVLSRYMTLKQ